VRPAPGQLGSAHNARRTHGSANLVIFLVVGVIAGWLAGQLVRGSGFGLVGDLIVGVVGAVMAGWLLPTLGIHIGFGIIGVIIDAVIGAVTLLLVLRLVRRA
jgi:uncharacterized membrane protein YeaQ/YmgE (transglycosylase-associated protein family)